MKTKTFVTTALALVAFVAPATQASAAPTLADIIASTSFADMASSPHLLFGFGLDVIMPHPTEVDANPIEAAIDIATDIHIDFEGEKAVIISSVEAAGSVTDAGTEHSGSVDIDNESRFFGLDAYSKTDASVQYNGSDMTPFLQLFTMTPEGDSLLNNDQWVKTKMTNKTMFEAPEEVAGEKPSSEDYDEQFVADVEKYAELGKVVKRSGGNTTYEVDVNTEVIKTELGLLVMFGMMEQQQMGTEMPITIEQATALVNSLEVDAEVTVNGNDVMQGFDIEISLDNKDNMSLTLSTMYELIDADKKVNVSAPSNAIELDDFEAMIEQA